MRAAIRLRRDAAERIRTMLETGRPQPHWSHLRRGQGTQAAQPCIGMIASDA